MSAGAMESAADYVPGAETPKAAKAEVRPDRRANSWVFTLNNYTDADCAAVEALAAEAVYLVCGKEVGEQGTPHLQGYVKMPSTRTWSAMMKKFNQRAWTEPAKGTAWHSKVYTSKERPWLEVGEKPQPGKRTDLEIMHEAISEGASIRELVTRVSGTQAVRSAELLMKYIERKRNFKTEVMWFYGPEALDNEVAAIEWLGGDYYHTRSAKWFEGYDAHENVLLSISADRKEAPTSHQLMGLMGEREHRVENKGSTRQFLAKKLAIVARDAPWRELYPSEYESKAFARLIAQVKKIEVVQDGDLQEAPHSQEVDSAPAVDGSSSPACAGGYTASGSQACVSVFQGSLGRYAHYCNTDTVQDGVCGRLSPVDKEADDNGSTPNTSADGPEACEGKSGVPGSGMEEPQGVFGVWSYPDL